MRKSKLFGLDYAEVSADQRTLQVFFLGKAPAQITPANIRITGGARIRDVEAIGVSIFAQEDPTRDDYMEVRVNHPGDFSDYTIEVSGIEGFDVRYSSVTFNFKAGCPSDLDCQEPAVCPPPARTQPDINYLAKDYGSFRQLILDRLAVVMPQWRETHTADIGVMLVELLAYAGDYLSYYQDAVATEAYLGTARQRISVRRHVRLVDYLMHEGCNARAWVTISASADTPLAPHQIFFITAISSAPDQHVFQARELERLPAGSFDLFEPMTTGTIQLYASHSEIQFYTWGNCACCLPIGATSATLIDKGLHLDQGDVLIFEEVIGPKTGNPADADPSHRQAVRLTKVTPGEDPLYPDPSSDGPQRIVEIEWCPEDALTFPLCISAVMPVPDCTCKTDLSVARGNVILVDHGAITTETVGTVPAASTTTHCGCGCQPPETIVMPATFNPQLTGTPLTFSQLLPACVCAYGALAQDPRLALPWISLAGVETGPQGDVTAIWTPVRDLLESGPTHRVFVVEIDNDGIAHLRFGDGSLGMKPHAGTSFTASYRLGNGAAGNVGAEAIAGLVFREETAGAGTLVPRNPLAAVGGIEPEAIEEAKEFAPTAFKKILQRSITPDDYAALAADNRRRLTERSSLMMEPVSLPSLARQDQEEEAGEELPRITDICSQQFRPLQAAKARLCWNGSWYTVLVAIDPLSVEDAPGELCDEITAYLDPYRRVGYDVIVQPAEYAGLDLGLQICVLPHFLRGHVEEVLLQAFSSRVLPDGTKAFFHPDHLTFGTGVQVSWILAAAQAVQGVQSVLITRLARYVPGRPAPAAGDKPYDVPAGGVLTLGPFEIARLDRDPSFPEHGRLTLELGGGR